MTTYTSTPYYGSTTPLDMTSLSKQDQYYRNQYHHNQDVSKYLVSPPDSDSDLERAASETSAGSSSSLELANSGHSYADSSSGDWGDNSSNTGWASGIDFNDYIQDRFAAAFDPIPLDRSVTKQAQTSGKLNNKQRQLLELQAKAQARLAKSRARFADGVQDAQEVRATLAWAQNKVSSMKTKASRKHASEYQMARERYPSPESF